MLLHTSIEASVPHRGQQSLAVAIDAYGCGLTKMSAIWILTSPPFTSCPITISNTSNANTDTHIVPNSVAKLAASSIALEGQSTILQLTIPDQFGHNSNSIRLGKSPSPPYPSPPPPASIQFHYQSWEEANKGLIQWHFLILFCVRNEWEQSVTKAGANMAEFTIRSLSTMAFRNPSIQVLGLVPSRDQPWSIFEICRLYLYVPAALPFSWRYLSSSMSFMSTPTRGIERG